LYQKKTQIVMAKKEGVKKMFDNIAPDYDKLNHILSLNIDKNWRKKAVREIADEARPLNVLDVACGTGDFTIEIARKVPQGSTVVGVDISDGMIAVGLEKLAKLGIDAALEVADCEALPYEDNTFDRISVGFGVRNFEHLELGLSEMYRVLAPGGKLVILELSVPSNAFIRWCYKLYFLKILPFIGGLVSGDRSAYEYLPASVLRFPAPDKFMSIMKSAGFDVVEHRAMTLGVCRMYIGKKI
jgi:demethylmenaquinone methyltransferase/2-methoxy-6-polyprenyl-1,4-benzoquinol methylase